MERLPDEILLAIFDKLQPWTVWSVISKVCRRWRNLASHRVLAISEPSGVEHLHSSIVAVYMTYQLHSTKLLNEFFTKLQSVNLLELVICDQFPLDETYMAALVSNKTLQHLDVFVQTDFPQKYVPAQIKSLVVNNNVRPKFLTSLACYKDLNALHMHGNCMYCSATDMSKFLSLQALQLTHLTLRCPAITDSGWEALGQCKNLVDLRLYLCWSLRGGILPLHTLQSLLVLHITGCRMIRTQALHNMIEQLPPCLRDLNLSASAFSDLHIRSLVHSPPAAALRRVELWRCALTPAALLAMTSQLQALQQLDTDVELCDADVLELAKHPCLQAVRSCWQGEVESHLEMRCARARGARLRGGAGEGPSADLYYHTDAISPFDALTM